MRAAVRPDLNTTVAQGCCSGPAFVKPQRHRKGRVTHTGPMSTAGASALRTFMIADIRGYSRYTEEYGDEAAADFAAEFADLVAEGVEAHGGRLVELRGDEALAVFTSSRQAIRAAVDLQGRVGQGSALDTDTPLKLGIGIN